MTEAISIRTDLRLFNDAAESLFHLATVERRRELIDSACVHLEQSIQYIEGILTGIEGDRLRRSFLADKQRYYSALIDALLSRSAPGDIDKAFHVSEQSRGRSLIDYRVSTLRPNSSVLVKRKLVIRRKLGVLSNRLSDQGPQPGDKTPLRQQIDELLAEDTRIEALITDSDHSKSGRILNISDLQAVLRPGDLLLSYLLGDSQSYVWLITQRSSDLRQLAPRATLERLASGVISRFNDAPERKKRPSLAIDFSLRLQKLSEALLFPSITTSDELRRIVIVPDGILQQVPFAALPTVAGGRRLGLTYDLAQAPSASVFGMLLNSRSGSVPDTHLLTAFVDPVFDALDFRVKRSSSAQPQSSLAYFPRLPFSANEIWPLRQLSPKLNITVHEGFGANKLNFNSHQTWASEVVLVSTHSQADDIHPELSRIILSRVDAEGRAIDGTVWLYDIDDLHIHGSVVVLSACNAANGRREEGEGLISFARAFTKGGASGLVAPISDVEETSTSTLVGALLSEVAFARMPAGSALRRSRLQVEKISRWRDPYYWASFVLLGSWN